MARCKQEVFIYSYSREADLRYLEEYEKAREAYQKQKDELSYVENELRAVIRCLKVKGEGEISVFKKAYPNTLLEIKNEIKEIKQETLSTCFFVQNERNERNLTKLTSVVRRTAHGIQFSIAKN